jgi:hypothetical protein
MDQTKQEPTFEESVKQVMKTLPPPIRDYLARGGYSTVVKNLMFKYQLRIDQGGVLEREIMLLLMGIDNPDEFTQALIEEAKLDQKAVNGIVQDVNDQIFVPLQEEMRKGEVHSPEPARPIIPPARSQVAASSEPLRHIINKIPRPIVTPRPIVSDEKLLEDHEEPHIEFAQTPIVPPVPPAAPISPPPWPTTPPPPPQRPDAPIKPYSSDPYREPLDEKE